MIKSRRKFRVLPKLLMAVLVTGAVVFGAGLSGTLFSVMGSGVR
jgi:hypothetical protein